VVNVVLVNPPQPGLVDPHKYPPVGLAHLRAAVSRDCPGVECSILNLAGLTVSDAAGTIRDAKPDVVGYTATTAYWNEAVGVATHVHYTLPNAMQIIGGPHVTLSGETRECFDATFIGPAEGSLVRFLREHHGRRERGIYLPQQSESVTPAVEDVIGNRLHAPSDGRTAVVFSSYGCTNECAFCAACHMHRKVEFRNVDSVMRELRGIRDHGIRDVRFMDDTFCIREDRVLGLCDQMAELDLRWSCLLRVDQAHPMLLRAMRAAGCVEVGFGVESFDQAVLDAVCKRATVRENEQAILMADTEGLSNRLYMLISTPGETRATVPLNIAALERLSGKFTGLLLSTLMPYPGTAIYRDPLKFGALLLEPDPTKYTQQQYQGHDAEETPAWSPLLFDGMSRSDQLHNIRVMREYADGLKQNHRGYLGAAS